MINMSLNKEFCGSLRKGDPLVGIFVKMFDPTSIEILSQFPLDFFVIDAEHAPFGRNEIYSLILAAKAVGKPAIVRVPEGSKTWIASALDAGAAGIMVPHVTTADEALRLTKLMGFGKGGRGFSPSTRAAEFGGRGIARHFEMQPEETLLICQIEDQIGADNAAQIAELEGVDCLFVGPVDLAVSLRKTDTKNKDVVSIINKIVEQTVSKKKVSGMYLSTKKDAEAWNKKGVSLSIIGTDQAFLRAGASSTLELNE